MAVVQTSRLHFHVRESGSPDGVPLLLLHGSHATSRWWEPFLAILPDSIRAVAPDLRGCGHSTRTKDGYEIKEQAEDIAELVRALALSDFDLVGHGSGGAIAIEFALGHPQALRSLILVDSAPIEGAFTPLQGLQLLSQMREDRSLLRQGLSALLPTAPPPTMTLPEFESFFEQLVDDAAAMAPAAFTAVAEALGRWNRLEDAHRLTLPTLLLQGSEDIIVERDEATGSLLAIPGASNLEILRGVGHSPMIESPVVLAERIIDFITEDFEGFEEARDYAQENAASADNSRSHE
ncbi:MAG: alpha/beta hydrolase [Caldilineaceae bacterium SB0668_bin_21]|nr:alpha/beta hydrolase [Caldilineaceae bacterium SB0668_bin_21]MYC20024.1 alpha/beta hydrolase [Caldilineaceae bacterium SB0662_bin_25]